MMEAWTLETVAASFSPCLRLYMMWMRLFHLGKWRSCFETKRKGDFCIPVSLFFLSVCPSPFLFDDGGLDFGDCSRIILALFAPVNDVDEALSSWKMEVLL
jgi:hypothetical protein